MNKQKFLSRAIITSLLTMSFTATAFANTAQTANDEMQKVVPVEQETSAQTTSTNEIKAKKAQDILSIKGLMRYDIRRDNVKGKKHETKKSLLRTRIEPTLNLGNGWKIKNRVDYDINYKNRDNDHFYNRMLYLQGPAFGGNISLGKVDYADFANMDIAYGMIFDDYIKGAKYAYADKTTDTIYTVAVGNFDSPNNDLTNGKLQNYPEFDAMHYVGLQAESTLSDRWTAGLAYHNVRSGELSDTQQIFELASEYKLDKNFKLGGVYAASTLNHGDYNLASSDQERAYAVKLNYKGAKRTVPNTFGIWAAYRNLGQLATFMPTYTNNFVGQQGYELGGKYVFAKNFTGEISYFNGNYIDNHDKNLNRWFGRLEYRF